MEGFGYKHYGEGPREKEQPSLTNVLSREGERYVRQTLHGHETAAQRYSATRILAGLGPER